MRLLPLLVVVTGCVGITKTHHVMTGRPGVPTASLPRIYMQGAAPPDEVQEVAILQATAHPPNADMPHVIEGLQSEGAKLGCTAIVQTQVDQGVSTASATGVCVRPIGSPDRQVPGVGESGTAPSTRRCSPELDPRWAGASAVEKKAMIDQCQAPGTAVE